MLRTDGFETNRYGASLQVQNTQNGIFVAQFWYRGGEYLHLHPLLINDVFNPNECSSF